MKTATAKVRWHNAKCGEGVHARFQEKYDSVCIDGAAVNEGNVRTPHKACVVSKGSSFYFCSDYSWESFWNLIGQWLDL